MLSLNCFQSTSDSSDQSNNSMNNGIIGCGGAVNGHHHHNHNHSHHHHHHHYQQQQQQQHSNNRFSIFQNFRCLIPSQLANLFTSCFRCCYCFDVCINKNSNKNKRKQRFSFNRDRRISFPIDLQTQQQQQQQSNNHSPKIINNIVMEKSIKDEIFLSNIVSGQVPMINKNINEHDSIDEEMIKDDHHQFNEKSDNFNLFNRLFLIKFFNKKQKQQEKQKNDDNIDIKINSIYHHNDNSNINTKNDQQFHMQQSSSLLPSSSKQQSLIFQQLSISSLNNDSSIIDNNHCDVISSTNIININNKNNKNLELFESKNNNESKNENNNEFKNNNDKEIRDDTDDVNDKDDDKNYNVMFNQPLVPFSGHNSHQQQQQQQQTSSSFINSLIKSSYSKKSVVPTVVGLNNNNNNTQRDKQTRMNISSKRLMKEIGDLMRRRQQQLIGNFSIELINDSLYEWYIKIYEFDKESQIYLDMQQYQIEFVQLHAIFPESYPFEPPFIRVVQPYIERGYVMEGGAICLELLTKNGWTSAYTMESVIIQLIASFVKGQATIKITKDVNKCFTKKSALNSFRHIVRIHDKHGWVDAPLYEG